MAKDNREILSGVRIGNDVFISGQEDELAAALTQKDGSRLLEIGTLQGDWEFSKGSESSVSDTNKEPEPDSRAVLSGIDKRAISSMKSAGFDTVEKIADASDDELRLPYVTDAVIEKVRAQIKAYSDAALASLQSPSQ